MTFSFAKNLGAGHYFSKECSKTCRTPCFLKENVPQGNEVYVYKVLILCDRGGVKNFWQMKKGV